MLSVSNLKNNSRDNNKLKKTLGYSLLEVIVVLAIVAFIMSGIALYLHKVQTAKNRQTLANALVAEMAGLVKFVNSEQLSYRVDTETQNHTETNPLYTTASDSKLAYGLTNMWADWHQTSLFINNAHSVYNYRVWYPDANHYSVATPDNTQGTILDILQHPDREDPIAINGNWNSASNSPRDQFTDGGCHSGFTHKVYLMDSYLPGCAIQPLLTRSSLTIDRIDLVRYGSPPTVGAFPGSVDGNTQTFRSDMLQVNRIDIFVDWIPEVANKPGEIFTMYAPLIDALQHQGLTPDIYLVERTGGNWQYVLKTGQPAASFDKTNPTTLDSNTLITFAELPGYLDKLKNNVQYGILFSFNGKGSFLRPDGSVSASKLCWDAASGKAGPCITASDDGSALKVTNHNSDALADLQVNNVVMQRKEGGNTIYYTAPYIQYKSFSNTSLPPCYSLNDTDYYCRWPDQPDTSNTHIIGGRPVSDILANVNGPIIIPRQDCPVDPANTSAKLLPRLSVAVSSVLAGTPKDRTKLNGNYFSDLAGTFSSMQNGAVQNNRLGGVVFTVKTDSGPSNWKNWVIGSSVLTEQLDDGGYGWIYANPPWLSAQVTTWCDSVGQNYESR